MDTAMVLSIDKDTRRGVLVGFNDERLISNSMPT